MEFLQRKSPRIQDYSYATPNYYFITICTGDKQCIFGEPGKLNDFGRIAEENLLQIPQLNPDICIDKYVVMPNHIHGIFVVRSEKTGKGQDDIRVVIGQYKSSVTRRIREIAPGKQVWQRSFHDHVIRDQKGYEKIWMYIENNPLKWEEDCLYLGESRM